MGTFLGILIFIALVAYAHKEYTQFKIGVSPKGASPATRLALAEFIRKNVPEKESVIDVGSGWGGMMFYLASTLSKHRVTGIEFSFTPWLISQFRSFKYKDIYNLSLIKGDIFKTDLRQFSLVYCNLPPKTLKYLAPKIRRELSPSSYFVSLNAPIKEWGEAEVIDIPGPRKTKLYVYQQEAKNTQQTPVSSETYNAEHNHHNNAVIKETTTKPVESYYKDGVIFAPMQILGHRGSGKTAPYYDNGQPTPEAIKQFPPENTYESCLRALQDGANGIDIDVIRSQDGELIVCHDNDLSIHMTPTNIQEHGAYTIQRTNYDKLETLPIGYVGYKLATLDEILSLAVKFNALLNIELKGIGTALPVLNIINDFVRNKHLNKEQIIISSFDHAQLKEIRDNDSDIRIGLLFEVQDKPVLPLYPDEPGSPHTQHFSSEYVSRVYDSIKPFSLHVNADEIGDDLTTAMTNHKLQTFIWWLDEPTPPNNEEFLETMYHLKQENMPFHLITDYPAEVTDIMGHNITEDITTPSSDNETQP